MNLLLVLLGILGAAALVIWGVDYYHYLVEKYCRYHIGRWPDKQVWRQAVEKKAIAWSVKAPTVKITDNNRYLLLDMLQGKHRPLKAQTQHGQSEQRGLWACRLQSS